MTARDRELRPLRRRYSGVLWQHPVVRLVLPALDLFDRIVRSDRQLAHLPPYSTRVRSGSMIGEFGGRRWATSGQQLTRTLIEHMGLQPQDRVLEVGCGAGRVALALAEYLENRTGYTGFDVDERAIHACETSIHLYTSRFTFFVADVVSEIYRPDGAVRAAEYRFPLADGTFDLAFAASVFTHMLEDDCANYARELTRMLKSGGTAAVSTYLHIAPSETQAHRFAHQLGSAYVEYPQIPTKLVSYELDAFRRWFADAELRPLLGRWRQNGTEQTSEWQDWIVVRARGATE